MQTRTLLLLSLVCGLVILLAGVVLMLQIADRDDVAPPRPLGVEVPVGDMVVIVDGSIEAGGRHVVELRIGGVDDPTGTEGFSMIAAGESAPLVVACGATRLELAPCTLEFEVGDDTGTRVLVYRRGDQSERWVLRGVSSG